MRIWNRIELVCSRVGVDVEYVFQDLFDIPTNYSVPAERTKPWGTGQAVLAAKSLINAPFTVINVDDYYGKESFIKMNK